MTGAKWIPSNPKLPMVKYKRPKTELAATPPYRTFIGRANCKQPQGRRFLFQVMQKQSDDQVAVAMVTEAQKRFPNFNACSFDKVFHSLANQIALKAQLDRVVDW